MRLITVTFIEKLSNQQSNQRDLDRVEKTSDKNNVKASIGEQRLVIVQLIRFESRTHLNDTDNGDEY